MVLRRAFFHWLLPSAFLLPLWMVVGWAIFGQSGWALLWVLLIAVPSLFIGQLVLTLLTRSRPSVRAERAVSWWDVLGFAVWHGLTIAVACFIDGAFPWLLTGAIAAALGLFWLQLWQLWNEARGSGARIRETITWSSMSRSDPASSCESEVFIVEERRPQD
ncbi:MFS transporter permease [Microbacterium esteraromaticum]|uniref:MFS transporter permease n=1 Tax=Microbacterium esteraromaticum TaxID=57043 RepID=UPI0023687950|nr:MFS transporter permease [Microbacterium esteraromaticum]WDH80120.1 MFS transporter permease [Microbacterium esteraromaticum]